MIANIFNKSICQTVDAINSNLSLSLKKNIMAYMDQFLDKT